MFLLLGLVGSLFAQSDGSGPLTTTPPLSQVFPMVETPAGVQMASPILLNLNTIIPAHATLRVCYIRPQPSDGSSRQILGAQSFEDGAMSRQTEARVKMTEASPEMKEAVRIATKTVWPVAVNFQHAFDLMSGGDMRVVYLDPKTGSFTDEIFNLPEGLLLTEQGGKVVVLAVEEKRSAQAAGILPGDQVLGIGGKKLDGTLQSFVDLYRAGESAAETSGDRKVVFLVQRTGEAAAREIRISRPPSLKGSLLDMN